ncbi:MAG: hypothetical protein ABI614_26940 [Planctomycetota bacterium]
MTDVHWLPEAEEDYEEAYEWYFQQSERAAEGLERAINDALQRIPFKSRNSSALRF